MLPTPEFYEAIDRIREHLDAKYAAREEALKLAREVVRAAANAVRAAHRGEFEAAEALLAEGRQKLQAATQLLAEHPDILWAGFIGDAAKELVEAHVTFAVIANRPVPGPEELKVEPLSYLQGLAEAVGELRRHLLDLIRTGQLVFYPIFKVRPGELHGLLWALEEAATEGRQQVPPAPR